MYGWVTIFPRSREQSAYVFLENSLSTQTRRHYSLRKATAGSTLIPARAGMRTATRATRHKSRGTTMKVKGS
jgi:hypothetical protein